MDKKSVQSSMECHWRMRQVKFYSIFLLCIPLLVLIVAPFYALNTKLDPTIMGEVLGSVLLYCVSIYALLFLPFLLYSLYHYLHLVRNYHKYSMHTVVLDKPHTSMLYRGAVSFTVIITDPAGEKRQVDTSPLFSDAIFSSFTLDEYAGSAVRVFYDEEMSKVYLINKI